MQNKTRFWLRIYDLFDKTCVQHWKSAKISNLKKKRFWLTFHKEKQTNTKLPVKVLIFIFISWMCLSVSFDFVVADVLRTEPVWTLKSRNWQTRFAGSFTTPPTPTTPPPPFWMKSCRTSVLWVKEETVLYNRSDRSSKHWRKKHH